MPDSMTDPETLSIADARTDARTDSLMGAPWSVRGLGPWDRAWSSESFAALRLCGFAVLRGAPAVATAASRMHEPRSRRRVRRRGEVLCGFATFVALRFSGERRVVSTPGSR